MSSNSEFHNKIFSPSTKTKLALYNSYVKNATPLFLACQACHSINIYDFFCGPGIDPAGRYGSPLLAIRTILEMSTANETSKYWGKPISFYFNDISKIKIDKLKINIDTLFGERIKAAGNITINYSSDNFDDIFNVHISNIQKKNTANIIFADQFGLKQITSKHICELSKASFTDTIIFISSSAIVRFSDLKIIFRNNGINVSDFKSKDDCHDAIVEGFKKIKTPDNIVMYYGGFAFECGKNLYGLIFCSKSIEGIYKFLDLCWKEDPESGKSSRTGAKEKKNQLSLWEDMNDPYIEFLQDKFEKFIKTKKPANERDLVVFCIENWMKPRDCQKILNTLKKKGYLQCSFSVPQSKENRQITYL